MQVTQAVVNAVGADKVGHRLSPYAPFNDALDSDPVPLCTYLASKLSDMGLAYLHCITARIGESAALTLLLISRRKAVQFYQAAGDGAHCKSDMASHGINQLARSQSVAAFLPHCCKTNVHDMQRS